MLKEFREGGRNLSRKAKAQSGLQILYIINSLKSYNTFCVGILSRRNQIGFQWVLCVYYACIMFLT